MKKYESGSLQAAKSKRHEKAPDYFGSIAIDIKDLTAVEMKNGLHIFRINGWKRQSDSGQTYLSLSVNRYVAEGAPRPKRSEPNDDIPF